MAEPEVEPWSRGVAWKTEPGRKVTLLEKVLSADMTTRLERNKMIINRVRILDVKVVDQ